VQPIGEPTLTTALIEERHESVMARLREACHRANRDPDGFRIVAVTKGFDASVVRMAIAAGLKRFGENRVQDAAGKVATAPGAEWHMVGHLQANKVRQAVHLFELIHSVDSLELMHRLDRIAVEEGIAPAALLQVNVTSEPTKGGFDPAWFAREIDRGELLLGAVRGLGAVRVTGLMTIGAAGSSADDARRLFARLRELRDRLAQRLGVPLPELSMGMSGDAESAVAEGATLVRIGTAIFGPRPDPLLSSS